MSLWSLPKHAESGKVRITNRIDPCTCGCGGRDPWHAAHFARIPHDVVYLDDVVEVKTRPFGVSRIVAYGFAQLPQGRLPIGFAIATDGYLLGWCVLAVSFDSENRVLLPEEIRKLEHARLAHAFE